ncbi:MULTISPECIES: helix-turn-helix domain-containing protein [Burkholderiaceae]|uniref:helix-turn-helix domain-containing protein n=1 Tax=Burkholderiaceae TaxID=119060 RepID=UPI0015882B8E|nr:MULTISPECIES: helix-turn-helix domain-containing protein [Burkholderiaceae]MBU7436122.1 helix-turn-helix domain-containing protein [Paraburkholderia fungorum]
MTTAPSTPLTVKEAAQALAVSDGRVMQFLRAGVLTLAANPDPDPSSGPQRSKHHVDPSSVEALRQARAKAQVDKAAREARRQSFLAARQRLQTIRDAQAQGLLTPADAARELGMSRQLLHFHVHRGNLVTVTVAGRRLVQRSDLDAFKQRRDGH